MSRTLILVKGNIASGKSTWARQFIDENPNYKRINRDSLRDMLDNGKWSESKEKHIRKCELLLAEYFYHQGFNLVADDTNLSPSAISMWQEFAKKMGMTIEVKDFTDVSVEECIRRDLKRPNSIGEREIRKMHRKYLYTPPSPTPDHNNKDLPWAVLADIDGTLAHMGKRDPYDTSNCEEDDPNPPVIATVQRSYHAGDRIIITTGREDKCREQTEQWLKRYLSIPYDLLLMRYTGDFRKDSLVKREMYEEHIQGKYRIRLCLDDRSSIVQVWRSLGLPCFQVAEGDF